MIIIGHRGASGYAPEHTFASWDLALRLGVDYIEQDLQMTRDGELVVMHDPTLDRTTNGSGNVIDRSLAEIADLDAGSWFSPEFAGAAIPALRDVFQKYGHGASYYIETKNPEEAPGMEEKLLALLAEFELRDPAVEKWQVLIQSFSAPSLLKIRELDAALPLIQLIGKEYSSADIRAVLPQISAHAVGIGPAHPTVDAELVAAAHDLGLVVHPYTVNEPADLERMVALGVDGVFTDYPDRVPR